MPRFKTKTWHGFDRKRIGHFGHLEVQSFRVLTKIQSYAPLPFNAFVAKLIHVYLKAISQNTIKAKISFACWWKCAIIYYPKHTKESMYRFFFESVYISQLMKSWYFSSSVYSFFKRACAAIQWGKMSDFWHASGPEFDPHVRHILSWRLGHVNISMAILPLPLIQEEQFSVTGERMSTKYW